MQKERCQPCTVFVKRRGASSTMPHKRNPISSELMCQHAGLMLDGMVQDYLARTRDSNKLDVEIGR
jgi:adenylosuccinate lyase